MREFSLERDSANPLIRPNEKLDWMSRAVFNGSVLKEGNTWHIVYRAIGKKGKHEGKDIELSTIGYATSKDGIKWSNHTQIIVPEEKWELYGCEDPRITKIDNEYFIFYTALSKWPPDPTSIKIGVAVTKDYKKFKKYQVTPFNSKAMSLFPKKIGGKLYAVLSPNTDHPPARLAIRKFDKKEDIWDQKKWRIWYRTLEKHSLPLQRMRNDQVEAGAVPLETDKGWLIIFSYIRNYMAKNTMFTIEAALLDKKDPTKIVGRVQEPLLVPEINYELEGMVKNVVFPSGAVVDKKDVHVYYGAADNYICRASIRLKDLQKKMRTNLASVPKFERYRHNPILIPHKSHKWENKAVLNPAAIEIEDLIYIVYRAQSDDNVSTFGLAVSKDGTHITERIHDPIYTPRADFEVTRNPGGNSGCEDPRLTRIGDSIYMLYTGYNGVNPPGVVMTSISVADFLDRNWEAWAEPRFISPKNMSDKDAVIFPEKINGKYVIMHRIEPNIALDYRDELTFAKELKCEAYITPREHAWDSVKIGANVPPIKTKKGWLLIYHGISGLDREYRVGAMLLDLNDPAKVISRTHCPILEPVTDYERFGLVNNVVFPCGAVVKKDTLFLYYGGADMVVGVAEVSLSELVASLEKETSKTYIC